MQIIKHAGLSPAEHYQIESSPGDKMQHFFQEIHGWTFLEDLGLFQLAVESAPDDAHFVEIGSWKGQSAAFMAVEIINSGKRIKLDCVDTWQGSEEHQAGGFAEDADVVAGCLYERFIENMRPVEGHYQAIRTTSLEASQLYPDGSLDFVYLDAAHDYDNIYADIQAWLPKVKVGGIFGADDYPCPAMLEVIKVLLPKLGYDSLTRIGKTWYIIKK